MVNNLCNRYFHHEDVEQRLAAVSKGGELLMAAAYDGDGNRVFQKSIREVTEYIRVEDISKEDSQESPDMEAVPETNSSADKDTVWLFRQ